jgi:hypothetical protein
MLLSPETSQKLITLFGENNADRLLKKLNADSKFSFAFDRPQADGGATSAFDQSGLMEDPSYLDALGKVLLQNPSSTANFLREHGGFPSTLAVNPFSPNTGGTFLPATIGGVNAIARSWPTDSSDSP